MAGTADTAGTMRATARITAGTVAYGGYGGYGYQAACYPSYATYGGYGNYYSSYSGFGSYGGSPGFYGIAATGKDLATPAVTLASNTTAAKPATSGFDGTFRYDGGPANPVPQPKPDANPSTRATPPATGLPVSLSKAKPTSPYTYKAYGEK